MYHISECTDFLMCWRDFADEQITIFVLVNAGSKLANVFCCQKLLAVLEANIQHSIRVHILFSLYNVYA